MKCLFYQWRISRAIDDGDHAALPTAHLENCPRCRAFYEGSRLMDSVMQPGTAISSPRPTDRKSAPISIWWVAAGASAAAAALLTMIFLQLSSNRRQSQPVVIAPPPTQLPVQAALPPLSIPSPQEALSAFTESAKKPFVRQFEAVSADAKAAANTVMTLAMIDLPPQKKP